MMQKTHYNEKQIHKNFCKFKKKQIQYTPPSDLWYLKVLGGGGN